jgi:lipopolysaccharide assembly outer membrane protein LptD (OstA)
LNLFAQEINYSNEQSVNPDTISLQSGFIDSIVVQDTSVTDTLPKKKKSPIDDPVKYNAKDSMRYAILDQKVFLYGDAKVTYQDIELKADYIEFNMATKEVFAQEGIDSLGEPVGKPHFKQGSEEFDAKSIHYNFETKKGYIKSIITVQEQTNYIHSESTKRLPSGDINIKKGKYTTCDAEDPHFYVGMNKAIAKPGTEIVARGAYGVVEGIPVPLYIPFGFFPITKSRSAGILVPSYGYEVNRGYYLRDGGYYFPMGEHVDLALRGTIYTNGTWGLNAQSRYRVRYKYNGGLQINYFEEATGERGIDYSVKKDFKIMWSHSQDSKANPNQRFSANVNFGTSGYDKNYSYNAQNRIDNTKSSSVSYSRTWARANLSTGLNISQNTDNNALEIKFPTLNFNLNDIYPFRSKNYTGKTRWYQEIRTNYTANLSNQLKTIDSVFFAGDIDLKQCVNGFRHSIPLSTSFKVLKLINITPSVGYNGNLYTSHINKWYDSINSVVMTDTIFGLSYAQAINPSIGVSIEPKLYGMYQFRSSRILAMRHVSTFSASARYTPDMGSMTAKFYKKLTYIEDGDTITEEYSIYDNSLYDPPAASGKSASLSLAWRNNLELKRISKKDTTGTPEKVRILDNFDFNTSYNPFATNGFHWNNIGFVTGTSLFKGKMSMRLNSTLDPYGMVMDSVGKSWKPVRVTKSALEVNNTLFRITNATFSVNLNLQSSQGKQSKTQEPANDVNTDNSLDLMDNTASEFGNRVMEESYGNVDFSIPWTLNIGYSWSYRKPYTKNLTETTITQSITVSGDFNLTEKWKIGFNTAYDFMSREFTATNLNIYRDLHCWEMSLNIVPFGQYRSYSFKINVKSSVLKDLKLDKKQHWYDNL